MARRKHTCVKINLNSQISILFAVFDFSAQFVLRVPDPRIEVLDLIASCRGDMHSLTQST